VIKNRSFEETSSSFEERNASEITYFRTSNFKCLPKDCVGIDSLRNRPSALLFEHVRKELPSLRNDLEEATSDANTQLAVMGDRHTTPSDRRRYLARLSIDYFEASRPRIDGHYEGDYFHSDLDSVFSIGSLTTIRRFRAFIQFMNIRFSEEVRTKGQNHQISLSDDIKPGKRSDSVQPWRTNLIPNMGQASPPGKGFARPCPGSPPPPTPGVLPTRIVLQKDTCSMAGP
jgi:hypothetical protein